jgi:CBS domain containing-hemolysin-like protein
MVVSRLGRVPAPGEEVTVDGFLFRVLESDGRAVRTVAVERRDPVEEDAPGLRRH